MKKSFVHRMFVTFSSFCLMLALSMTPALAWDLATHAYIEEHLFKKTGQADSAVMYNRIYGAGAIDIFNNNFTSPYLEFEAYLHDTSREDFLKAWEIAASRNEKAFAYGFVSHNNTWGMDSTAHVSGRTFGRGEGYVIAKARALAAMLGPAVEAQLAQLGLPPVSEEVLVNLFHYLVESGVDFLIRDKDPEIGSKLMAAAFNRSAEVPTLLAEAYKSDFAILAGYGEDAAASFIATAEGDFRASMMAYGYALTQANALDLVAGGLAAIGVSYLGLPPGPNSVALLVPIAQQGIVAAKMLCAPDLDRELHASTGWVNGRLNSNGIAW